MIKTRTLTQMQYRPTAYEVAINGEPVAFIERKTKMALYNVMVSFIEKIRPMITDLDAPVTYSKTDGWTIGGNVKIHFTGRTERDVASKQGNI